MTRRGQAGQAGQAFLLIPTHAQAWERVMKAAPTAPAAPKRLPTPVCLSGQLPCQPLPGRQQTLRGKLAARPAPTGHPAPKHALSPACLQTVCDPSSHFGGPR